MQHTLYAHVRGSMGDQSTVSNMPYSMLASRGGQSRNSARHRDRTTDLTVCSPTPPPLHQCGGCIVRLVYSIYNSSSMKLLQQAVLRSAGAGVQGQIKKIEIAKCKFMLRCCDVIAAMWCFNAVWLILWFLCLIMTHRVVPYWSFLTVEAWGGAYPLRWSRCIITN